MTWLTSEQTLAILGGKRQTLYANVSRGRIRVRPDPEDSRRSLYHRADVAALAGRRRGRRSAATVAAEAIGWGEPVLPSSVSAVVEGRLWYRGRDAIQLAQEAALEVVADLLWQVEGTRFPGERARSDGGADVAARAMRALADRLDAATPSIGRSGLSLAAEAARLIGGVAAAVLGERGISAKRLHDRIVRAWARPATEAEPIRQALVLLAEHELNASSFAVRVAASTGAPVAACLIAGLATLSGPRHGGVGTQIRALAAVAKMGGGAEAIGAWLAQGRALPGFGHPLYPEGDPRARLLTERVKVRRPIGDLARAATEATGEAPNVDFALFALADALDWPDHAPLALFALARCVGWTAHLIEQAMSGGLIRPRARYVGPPLGATP
jgi:citrate synthase